MKISNSLDDSLSEADLMVMVEIEKNSSVNQRALAQTFNISLGKINYCIKALIDIGFIKLDNFSNAQNKLQYLYILTPQGIAAKTRLTKKFLKIKEEEYNQLKELLKQI
ncbi:MarR family EPS-associated transcriptional regulator [Gammaproteobacteria bacterium]|nr:MarR family EPS-associated transcriptional regulator [Gammaproteobacteria bacterium]MDB4242833.1 MarR family EPS-associated transcriptional regulator [Gammaproteobacteria bacterium]